MSATIETTDVLTPRERELGAIIAAYNDVTERLKESHDRLQAEVRRLRMDLEQKNRELARRERLAALGEMAAGLAHEIRNPLGGIQLFAGLLARDLADRPEQKALVEKIAGGVRALDRLVGDILAFAGQTQPRPAPVKVNAVIAASLELAQAAFQREGASVHWTRDESLDGCNISADAEQLQQALLNLLVNAAEAAGAGGRVIVTAGRTTEGGVRIEIADTGPGIPPDLLEKVFNPFFTTKDRGTGLGLAIVHRIVEAHGGAVRASNGPAGGAVFTVLLPPAAPSSSAAG